MGTYVAPVCNVSCACCGATDGTVWTRECTRLVPERTGVQRLSIRARYGDMAPDCCTEYSPSARALRRGKPVATSAWRPPSALRQPAWPGIRVIELRDEGSSRLVLQVAASRCKRIQCTTAHGRIRGVIELCDEGPRLLRQRLRWQLPKRIQCTTAHIGLRVIELCDEGSRLLRQRNRSGIAAQAHPMQHGARTQASHRALRRGSFAVLRQRLECSFPSASNAARRTDQFECTTREAECCASASGAVAVEIPAPARTHSSHRALRRACRMPAPPHPWQLRKCFQCSQAHVRIRVIELCDEGSRLLRQRLRWQHANRSQPCCAHTTVRVPKHREQVVANLVKS